MNPSKPLIMKTYGKQMRKVSAWLPPENRKQVFDSSVSTDCDVSIFEASKRLKRSKRPQVSVTGRAGRLAKRKAMLCLAEESSNEKSSSSSSSFESTCKRKPARNDCPPKKKTKTYKSKTSSDENEKRNPPSPPDTQQGKDTSDNLPSVGRFVTRRRRTVTAKPKHPKASSSLVNSSGDFASGALGCSRFLKPSRRRNVPPTFVVSSAENSRISGFAPNALKEISLNAPSDHALGSCPRKPIFCSTPSAGHFSSRRRPKSTAVGHTSDHSGSPTSASACCSGVPPDLDSLWRSPPPLAPELHSEEQLRLSFGEREPSDEPSPRSSAMTGSCSHETENRSPGTGNESDEGALRLNHSSTEELDSVGQFEPVSGELEWLMEALKEKCLRVPCAVQLRRLRNRAVSQLCGQTAHSSCLGRLSKGYSCQASESLRLYLSVTANKSDASEPSGDTPSVSPPRSKKPKNPSEPKGHRDGEGGEASAVEAKDECFASGGSVGSEKTRVAKTNGRRPGESRKERSSDAIVPEGLARPGGRRNKASTSKTQRAGDRYSVGGPEIDNLALAAGAREDCLTDRFVVRLKRLSLSPLKVRLQSSRGDQITRPELLDSSSDDQIKTRLRSDDNGAISEDTCDSRATARKNGLTSSEETIMSEQDVLKDSYDVRHKRKKTSVAPRDKKRTTPADRPRTVRKACVSGLSVNRWKSRDASSAHAFGNTTAQSSRAVDCSISEMIPAKSRKQTRAKQALESTINFSTPLRVSRLNLSSLLADFTPNTHTWSRIKAVLSVHRKGMVLQNSGASLLETPRRAALADVSQDLFATPISKRLPSQMLHNVSTVECADGDLSDAEKVYAECGQQCPLPWEECILPQRMKQCVKIGEGTFGEVFSVTNASGETVALKVIPVEGCEQVNGEDQKTFGEILHEIIISKELSHLKEKEHNQTDGFIGLNDLHCVRGCYPPDFMEAWDTFDQEKCSENDRPDFFKKDQIFLILEFEFGGSDLENSNGKLASLGVAKSVLHQVTAALAVAEQELHFEHRDLHWGNVLVKPTKQKQSSFLLNGAAHSVDTSGVLVRIIDYSLSRLEIDDLTVSCDISKDEELFMGQGDYQFEIYRLMRKQNGNIWSEYHPRTNVLWLHYLCSKLLSMKYRSSRGKAVKEAKEALAHFSNDVLRCGSATELLQSCPMFQK